METGRRQILRDSTIKHGADEQVVWAITTIEEY
jgi:hypothetical protein